MDDKREKFYRAEIRNKVYKRELLQLEAQIATLLKTLEYYEHSAGSSSTDKQPLSKGIQTDASCKIEVWFRIFFFVKSFNIFVKENK